MYGTFANLGDYQPLPSADFVPQCVANVFSVRRPWYLQRQVVEIFDRVL